MRKSHDVELQSHLVNAPGPLSLRPLGVAMSPVGRIFEKQLLHLLCLMLLLAVLYLFSHFEGFNQGDLWGVDTLTWLYWLVGVTVIHQAFVWFCWRTELYSGLLSRGFGHRAFPVYAVLFFLLIISRPVLVTFLALANRDTIPINPMIGVSLAILLAVPSIYLMYSIGRYFGFKRAFGIDHFDTSYRGNPLVRKGIFRYTTNGMYVFGLLILWIPGVLFSSLTALTAALFSHIYIWVHYFCTEKPDMEFIYGE